MELYKIPCRYVWHGFFPSIIIDYIHNDKLLAYRIISKLIKGLLIQFHDLWIARCQIIHTSTSDGIHIKERIDLQYEIRKVTSSYRIQLDVNINKMITAQLKGWLFKFYSKQGDIEAYNNTNKRTLEYKNKINNGISEEGYILHKRILQLEDEFSSRYEENRLETIG
jgi:hypothetical protein